MKKAVQVSAFAGLGLAALFASGCASSKSSYDKQPSTRENLDKKFTDAAIERFRGCVAKGAQKVGLKETYRHNHCFAYLANENRETTSCATTHYGTDSIPGLVKVSFRVTKGSYDAPNIRNLDPNDRRATYVESAIVHCLSYDLGR